MARERKYEPYIEMEFDGDNIHIGAYVGGIEVGILDASLREDQILITNLYVMDEYRREYIATDLLNELVDYLFVEELHIPLSMDYILEDELSGLHEFILAREDFVVIPAGEEYVIPKDIWNDCFGSKQIEKMASCGVRIDELSNWQKAEALKALKGKELYMIPADMTFTDVYDSELSHMAFADDEFKAGILVKKVTDYSGEEMIELSVAICKAGCELVMMKILAGFLANMRKHYPNHSIRIFGVNDVAMNLAHKFFEGKAITKQGYSAIWMEI